MVSKVSYLHALGLEFLNPFRNIIHILFIRNRRITAPVIEFNITTAIQANFHNTIKTEKYVYLVKKVELSIKGEAPEQCLRAINVFSTRLKQ